MNAHLSPADGSIIAHPNLHFAAKRAGRPLAADSARTLKPWLAEGISERTFYRRKAMAAAEMPAEPVHQHAHVVKWLATLDPIARLEFKAYARRCHLACASARRPPLPAPFDLYVAARSVQ